jgi:phosphoheptose isomerase
MAPELGWMVSGMAIDPFNSNHMFYGTGMTMWGTTNLTEWDSGNQFALSDASMGIEETSVTGLASPPAGGAAHLYSTMGDIGGFIHTSMTTPPTFPYAIPFFGTRTAIDFAQLNPMDMVIVGAGSPTASPVVTSSAFTTSGGTSETSWFAGSVDPAGMTSGGGTVAMASNASSVVWVPPSMVPFRSTTYGSSWTAATGAPAGGVIASDRVNPLYYYYYAAGQFYVSSNGGVSFTATAATGLPASGDPVVVKAVPGIEGDVWVVGGSVVKNVYGMWHSTNHGASFTQLSNVTQADIIGFGAAGPGASYQTIFANAEIGGVRGIFASTNEGVTWEQINDSAHEYAAANQAMTGDPQVFGTVYIGTNGRGIVMGTGSPTVSSTGGFTLKPSATALTVADGASGTDTISVTDVSPFAGSVSFAATGQPSGVTAAFSPTSSATSSVLTLTASSTAVAGTYTITVTGTSGSLAPVTTSFTLTVTSPTGGFTLKPSSSALTVAAGSSGTDTITVTDISPFTGTVAFTATGQPTGVTAAFSPTSSATSSVLTLAVGSTVTAGTYTITVTGTSGTLTPVTTTFTLTVTGTGTFTLKPSATALSIAQGASGTNTITVTDVSPFAGSVSFAATGQPTGITAAFSPTSSTTSSVLTLTVASTVAAGTYTITVTGTSGTLTPVTTSFTLTVTSPTGGFTLKLSAAALTVAPGASGTDTITVTDISPFTGIVAFTATGQPTGVTAAFSPTSSATSSVLTLTVGSSTAAGTYTITVTGTSGTLAAVITTFTLTVPGTSKCTVDYTISSQWQGGFGAAIAIVNNGSTALTSWTLTWSFANGQTITQLWNGVESQSGANVTVNNVSYNGSISAGGTLSGMGFNGTWNNVTNAIPTAISLNGTACTVN